MAKKIGVELSNELRNFLCEAIGSKILDGITYALVSSSNKEKIAEYSKIRDLANKDGLDSSQLFRVYKVSNGYVFDMDLSTAKQITKTIMNGEENSKNVINDDYIERNPNERKKRDLNRLHKLCVNSFKAGTKEVEVALFSRNTANKIMISAKDKNTRENVVIQYEAFALRHWDIEMFNSEYLSKSKLRVRTLSTCEILPTNTGIRFILELERL